MAASPALMVVIALAAGGAAAVGTASVLSSDGDPVAAEEAASTRRALEGLRDEVARLTDEQVSVRAELRNLELQLATATAAAPARDEPESLAAEVDASELLALRQQVAQLSARVGGGEAEAGGPVVIETVSAALEQIREKEDQERAEARREARKEREVERLAELTEELTLDTYQQGKMSELIATYGESSSGIIDGARKSGDWGGIRSAFGDLHGEMDESLSAFLSTSQLDQLAQMGGARALSSSGWGNWGRSSSSSSSSNSGS